MENLELWYPSSDKKGAAFDNEATFAVVKSDRLKWAWVTLLLRDECVCVYEKHLGYICGTPFFAKPTHPKSQA